MGRVVTSLNNSVNLSRSSRSRESNFSEQVAGSTIGPLPSILSAGEAYGFNDQPDTSVYDWKVMSAGDEGLKQALYEFINTSKEGVNVEPDLVVGRQKRLLFNFYGLIGKSIAPGEIGSFEVIFQYPPAVAPITNTGTPSNA